MGRQGGHTRNPGLTCIVEAHAVIMPALRHIFVGKIVGGNIQGYTRTMTTAIALETSKGDLPLALALGVVLIILSMTVSGASLFFGRALTNC